jgi:hypothetical protein
MVGEVLTGLRMGEDREWSAVQGKELRNITKDVSRDGHLNASARVRTDGSQMEVTNRDRKTLLHRRGKLLRRLYLFRVVIDVGVEIAD